MNEANPFVISQFTPPFGEIVSGADFRIDGKRVRKNYLPAASGGPFKLGTRSGDGATEVRTAVLLAPG